MGALLEAQMENSLVYDTLWWLMIYWSQRGQWCIALNIRV